MLSSFAGTVEIVRRIASANGLEGRTSVCMAPINRIALYVDVAIADQAGPFGIGGGLFTTFNDARANAFAARKDHPFAIDLSIDSGST